MSRHPNSLKNLKPMQKGQKNPNGGRPPDWITKGLKVLTRKQLKEIIEVVITGNLEDLQKIGKNKKSTALQIWIASVAVKAIQKGDVMSLDKLLDRCIGKVKEEIDITGSPLSESVIKLYLPRNGSEVEE